MTTQTSTLPDFLLRAIAEDEAAAKAVAPLDHNFNMGGKRQDERFVFGRTLPSSADGMGNWSKHRDDPATANHFARHDPARVLAQCKAHRAIVELHGRPHECSVYAHGDIETCHYCHDADECSTLRALASAYADREGFDPRWTL